MMKRPKRTVIRIIGIAMLVIACLFSFDVWLRLIMSVMAIVLIICHRMEKWKKYCCSADGMLKELM